jgi:RNA polymerase sigma factor (sigma-70 family)
VSAAAGRSSIAAGQVSGALSGLPDSALVRACRAGDQPAWEALITRYQRLIFTVPLRLGLAEDEAGDVFQNTCLRLYEHLDSLRDPDRVGSWLARTAYRLSLDHLAARRPTHPDGEAALLTLPMPAASAEEEILLLEEQQQIRTALERMPDRCRELLRFLFYDPARPTYTEVARRLGLPLGSVGPIRQRCFERLRRLL